MKTWIANWWLAFTTGFWFVPGLFLVGGLILALVGPQLDAWLQQQSGYMPSSLRITDTTARATLAALSGAMFTVTGVVFSTTTVALSITSNQLGPRLLRNFLGQSITQITLGVCLASSVYSLILMRSIDKLDGSVFVPHGSLLLAIALGLLTLITVVYFTHRVVHSMQAQNVVSDVADDLDKAVEELFPERIGRRAEGSEENAEGRVAWGDVWGRFDDEETTVVDSPGDGYLQAIDDEGLMRIACEEGLVFRVLARPGDYVRQGEPLLEMLPHQPADEEVVCRVQRLFMRGNLRTTQQDVECAVNELVEVAIRALSPGINDPFTAIACIDRLSGTLRRLARRRSPAGLRADEDGKNRVVVRPRTFANVVDAAFNQLRQHATGDVAVTVRLLDAMTSIAAATERDSDRSALREQADMVIDAARQQGYQSRDLEDIEQQHAAFTSAIESAQSD